MSAVELTISGMLYDKLNRTTQNVVLIGEAFLTGLSVGGGPMPGGPPGPPVTIWPNPPEGQAPIPSHPIALPGDPWWPTNPPPQIPPPGSPPVMIPGTQPVHPIAVPPAIIVDYPGIGKVLVPQPTPPAP
jgi:hypothetical protein